MREEKVLEHWLSIDECLGGLNPIISFILFLPCYLLGMTIYIITSIPGYYQAIKTYKEEENDKKSK